MRDNFHNFKNVVNFMLIFIGAFDGSVAQWKTRLTTDQEIPDSTSGGLGLILPIIISQFKTV